MKVTINNSNSLQDSNESTLKFSKASLQVNFNQKFDFEIEKTSENLDNNKAKSVNSKDLLHNPTIIESNLETNKNVSIQTQSQNKASDSLAFTADNFNPSNFEEIKEIEVPILETKLASEIKSEIPVSLETIISGETTSEFESLQTLEPYSNEQINEIPVFSSNSEIASKEVKTKTINSNLEKSQVVTTNHSTTISNSEETVELNDYKEYIDFDGNKRMVKLSQYYPEFIYDHDDLFKDQPILFEAKNIKKDYVIKHNLFKKTIVHSVKDANFKLHKGETLSIVGESGSGKTTLAKIITNIEQATAGELFFKGKLINDKKARSQELRKSIQIIFQNPHSSLNPRKTIFKILEEPLILNTSLSQQERREKIEEIITLVGLKPQHLHRLPHMFSGGQKQRIAIARGLILNPDIVVADEAVSALDVSVQAQIVNLMLELQQKYNLAYIFISHDLSVVKHISHKIIVMYRGEIVEYGSVDQIFNNPQHPYTKSLLKAIPKLPRCTIATPCTKAEEQKELAKQKH